MVWRVGRSTSVKAFSSRSGSQVFMYCVAYQVLQFAVDKLLNPDSPNPLWMYGGDKCRNDLAIKVASHELKGMQAMFSCKVANLHFPLMCSIDYKGFCVLAECKLRISEKTLQYGSSDGGYTVVNRNATLSSLSLVPCSNGRQTLPKAFKCIQNVAVLTRRKLSKCQ